jgi:threonine dehydratase
VPATIADGAQTTYVGAKSFPFMRALVDDILTVSDEEVREAMQTLASAGITAEPSGAATTAAVMSHAQQLPPWRKAVLIVSGGNVEPGIMLQATAQ